MRILVITRNAWDDTNSIGNTMSNFFQEFEDAEFANIYFRSAKPNNSVCKRYYSVTEKDIIKGALKRQSCGTSFEYTNESSKCEHRAEAEVQAISKIHKYNIKPAYIISEKLWNSRKWENEKLEEFIQSFNPDVVFTFAKSAPQYYWTLKLIHDKFSVPIILWVADDEYTLLSESTKSRDKKALKRLNEIIQDAMSVYGCSEEICELYQKEFEVSVSPLYKNCYFKYPVKHKIGNPLRMVYAGNLLYGRLEILKKIIHEMSLKNENNIQIHLDIYSTSPVSQEDWQLINNSGVASFKGKKNYDEIEKILSEADIVLHVESFDDKEILKTKYSFSTKIIDCLQSGSVLLAVGPEQLASIKYCRRIDGAHVATTIKDFSLILNEIIEGSIDLLEDAKKIREYAINNHSRKKDWLHL